MQTRLKGLVPVPLWATMLRATRLCEAMCWDVSLREVCFVTLRDTSWHFVTLRDTSWNALVMSQGIGFSTASMLFWFGFIWIPDLDSNSLQSCSRSSHGNVYAVWVNIHVNLGCLEQNATSLSGAQRKPSVQHCAILATSNNIEIDCGGTPEISRDRAAKYRGIEDGKSAGNFASRHTKTIQNT